MTGGKVLVLGAGFSRAISNQMPLTDELGRTIVERLRPAFEDRLPTSAEPGWFEVWMSHLAEEQPFLTVAENYENRGLFLRVSEILAEQLGERVQNVLAEERPSWLAQLICLAHREQSTLITFNYDTLIECAVDTNGLLFDWPVDWNHARPILWPEVTGNVPKWPPGFSPFGGEGLPRDTFRLLKLHGSLNWYAGADDESGISVARRRLPGAFGRPQPYAEEERRSTHPGRAPFVVPPSTSKSSYYRNPITRELWRQAHETLRAANEVVLVGYSVPTADVTVADLLRSSIGLTTHVTILNPDGESVRQALFRIGVAKERITLAQDEKSELLPSFAARWSQEVGGKVVRLLRALSPDEQARPLLVAWGKEKISPVTAISDDGALLVGEPTTREAAVRSTNEARPRLLEALAQAGDDALRVRREASTQTVIGRDAAAMPWGHGDGNWHVLYPDGPVAAPGGTP